MYILVSFYVFLYYYIAIYNVYIILRFLYYYIVTYYNIISCVIFYFILDLIPGVRAMRITTLRIASYNVTNQLSLVKPIKLPENFPEF